MSAPVPTLDVERALAADCGPGTRIVVGVDEVGRGALAGPVAVGACAVEMREGHIAPLPDGVRDSKRLSALRRKALVQPILDSVRAGTVGWASPAEIDEIGIVAALSRAAHRALEGLDVRPDAILVDGDVDVLSRTPPSGDGPPPVVQLRVAADRDCASVAAASILAKVARDDHMVELDALAPHYHWASNKGYGSAAHREALTVSGPHHQHRRSWRLTGSADSAQPPGALHVPAGGAGVLWDDDIGPQRQEERP
ncbi:MAG TPA: ribonuclease HII [Candidatus Brachybacterium merdavium]|uniref:Ribonuclease HII n=1 Tax=Candidatus Brachybacterium merdavium TaxID=2838513 RepID=A0A9D2RN76_9MICO|nr:ribonuclease HII [Candidatus Brachybacterium merdavium]